MHFFLKGSFTNATKLGRGEGNHEFETTVRGGGEVTRSVTSHIFVKMKTFETRILNFEITKL